MAGSRHSAFWTVSFGRFEVWAGHSSLVKRPGFRGKSGRSLFWNFNLQPGVSQQLEMILARVFRHSDGTCCSGGLWNMCINNVYIYERNLVIFHDFSTAPNLPTSPMSQTKHRLSYPVFISAEGARPFQTSWVRPLSGLNRVLRRQVEMQNALLFFFTWSIGKSLFKSFAERRGSRLLGAWAPC